MERLGFNTIWGYPRFVRDLQGIISAILVDWLVHRVTAVRYSYEGEGGDYYLVILQYSKRDKPASFCLLYILIQLFDTYIQCFSHLVSAKFSH